MKYLQLILLGAALFVSITQLLLYIPVFTCQGNSRLPVCTPQFTFNVIETTNLSRELMSSIREFLKLLSFLAIDMGWNPHMETSGLYNDQNLVDTFNTDNYYKVNYYGSCKYKNGVKVNCFNNEHYGMDIMTILIRDIGLQLGNLTNTESNDAVLLGNSVVYTYKLVMKTLYNFIMNDKKEENMFSRILLNSSLTKQNDLSRIFVLMNWFLRFNYFIRLTIDIEMCLSVICVLFALLFLLQYLGLPYITTERAVMFVMGSLYLLAGVITMTTSIILQLVLTTIVPKDGTDWGFINVHVGSGFIIGIIRFVCQMCYFVLLIATIKYCRDLKKLNEPTENLFHDSSLPPMYPPDVIKLQDASIEV